MTALVQGGTRIGRLRVRASGGDAEAAARRCALALRGLDLEPPAMPPQAILCVRALADPRPGSLDVRRAHAGVRSIAWQAAMRASVRNAFARAVRPIACPVPADADAVLFADSSELLACAARDACRGSLASAWWWRHLMPAGSLESVLGAWRHAPEYVPAAFDLLTASADTMPFIRRVPPRAAAELLDAVLRAFALHALADEILFSWAAGAIQGPAAPLRAEARPRIPPDPATCAIPQSGLVMPPAPWHGMLPAEWDTTDLAIAPRTLAAMSLVLRRFPRSAHRAAFGRALVTFLRSATGVPAGRRPEQEGGLPVARRETADGRAASERPRMPHASIRSPEPAAPRPSRDPAPRAPAAVVPHPATAGDALVSPSAVSPESPTRAADGQLLAGVLPVQTMGTPSDSAAAVESGLAGAFFLLNVASNLELYGTATAPLAREIDLHVWEFLEFVTRGLLEEDDGEDPLWTWLQDLREPARSPYSPGRGDRADAVPVEPRSRELVADQRSELLTRVRGHLGELLDVEDPGPILIRRPGRMTRTPGHLDVHFSLEHHPIEIRLARLDRNPGWIPAAGLHVAFHFRSARGTP
jgi:hypothetical protein